VVNKIDPDARTPLLAHNEYWENPLFVNTLWEAIRS
jgi:hypothetical protein